MQSKEKKRSEDRAFVREYYRINHLTLSPTLRYQVQHIATTRKISYQEALELLAEFVKKKTVSVFEMITEPPHPRGSHEKKV